MNRQKNRTTTIKFSKESIKAERNKKHTILNKRKKKKTLSIAQNSRKTKNRRKYTILH